MSGKISRPGIIYLATNKTNGKLYVGKTVREFAVRIREHEYDSRNKTKMAFSRAIAKYGIEAITFVILETCAVSEIDARERHWISLHKCRKPHGYNLTDGGDGTLGVVRADISAINRAKVGALNPAFGTKHTDEENERNRQALTGAKNPRYGVTLDAAFRALISERTRAAMSRPEVREKYLTAIVPRSERASRRRLISIAERTIKNRNRRLFMDMWTSLADAKVRERYWVKRMAS